MHNHDGGLVKHPQSFHPGVNAVDAIVKTETGEIIDAEIVTTSLPPRRQYARQQYGHGIVGQMAVGIHGAMWTLRNPGKSFWRLLGWMAGLSAVGILVGFGTHLLVGKPNSASLAHPFDPVGWGKYGADWLRKPILKGADYTNDVLTAPPAQTLPPAAVEGLSSPETVLVDPEVDATPEYRR